MRDAERHAPHPDLLRNLCHLTRYRQYRPSAPFAHHFQLHPAPPAPTPGGPFTAATPWAERSTRGIRILQVPTLTKFSWFIHGFSTKPGGVSDQDGEKVLNLGFTEWDTKENVLENRRRFQSALDAPGLKLVSLKQIHSDVIHRFDAAPAQPCQGDASVTSRPGLLLGAQTADCVPILIVDPK